MPELPSAMLDIGQHEARPMALHRLHGLAVGAGDGCDIVSKADETFDVHGDDRLVLDDENVGRHLLGDLPADLVEQLIELADIDFEDGGGLVEAETLDGHQQERLTGAGRDLLERCTARRSQPSVGAELCKLILSDPHSLQSRWASDLRGMSVRSAPGSAISASSSAMT